MTSKQTDLETASQIQELPSLVALIDQRWRYRCLWHCQQGQLSYPEFHSACYGIVETIRNIKYSFIINFIVYIL